MRDRLKEILFRVGRGSYGDEMSEQEALYEIESIIDREKQISYKQGQSDLRNRLHQAVKENTDNMLGTTDYDGLVADIINMLS